MGCWCSSLIVSRLIQPPPSSTKPGKAEDDGTSALAPAACVEDPDEAPGPQRGPALVASGAINQRRLSLPII